MKGKTGFENKVLMVRIVAESQERSWTLDLGELVLSSDQEEVGV